MWSAFVLGLCVEQALSLSVVSPSLRGGERELLDLENLALLDGLPLWAKYLILTGVAVVGLLLIVCTVMCCVRLCRREDPALLENPYLKDNSYAFDPNSSGRQLVRKNDMSASPALANFMKSNPVHRVDPSDDSDDEDNGRTANSAPASFNKRVSTRATGQDYGLLDAEAKKRIQSIRMEGNIKPIVPNASSKAMKLLGVDESAIQRPFDEDVATRMKKLAAKSGGGVYSPGLATAALGNQIAQGFKERRAKQLEKARARKEKEEERRRQKDMEMEMSSKPSKPKPPPAETKQPKEPKEPPGPNKLAAFLASTSTVQAARDSDTESDAGSIDDTI